MSSYAEINARAWNDCRLLSAILELTHHCNYDCFYCSNDRTELGDALSLDEYASVLQQLADMQVLNLTLTGGEPLVHQDFFAIGARARHHGFVVRIKSNGHLIRGKTARRLKTEVDPYLVELSIHGATPATHDRQTRRPGSFDRLMSNIIEMKDLGLRLGLSCTLTAWNEHETAAILELGDELGFTVRFNSAVSPRDDGAITPLEVAPSRAGRHELARLLKARREQRAAVEPESREREDAPGPTPTVTRHCGAGASTIAIDQWGQVLPCVQWRRTVGNVREEPISEIWARSAALDEVRRITASAKDSAKRLRARDADAFFCPGMAELLAGDPLAVYEPTPLTRHPGSPERE